MEKKIAKLLSRAQQIEEELAKPEIIQDKKTYRSLAQEHAHLTEIKEAWEKLDKARKTLSENEELLSKEEDSEMQLLLNEEIALQKNQLPLLESKLETLLVPPDPSDSKNVIVELRAGTGGDEAALFVADCVRMYQLYCDHQKWKYEVLSCSASELGGFKEFIMVLSGTNVKRFMQYEGGTHRVQRVPATETQGRIHTSAITVAVLVEPDEEEEVVIEERDLRIDTYRASGAGGQHVNVTDSAVRITHIPTGIVSYCQEERSQRKNKDKAIRLLKAKIAEIERQKKAKETEKLRSAQVGTGDRSERIRTYNFPQNRVTDHRINLTLYHLDRIMEGELDPITSALVAHFHQEKLLNDDTL